MKRRELLSGLAAAALVSGCASQAPSRARTSPARYGSPVPLPSPTVTGTISLEKAIGERRSLRAFRPDPLPMATIGQLLWARQGVTSPDGKRAAPSAGALYPLELYVVTPEQVMHYLPAGHIEVGHAAQNILLQAAALGLASVPVGSLDPSRAADTLALPPDQTVLYLIPVGHLP
jgi:nitroreductase